MYLIIILAIVFASGYAEAEDRKAICYERMQEAMKLADKFKDDLWSPFIVATNEYRTDFGSIRCITSVCLQKELDEAKVREKHQEEREYSKKKWDLVMKECVK